MGIKKLLKQQILFLTIFCFAVLQGSAQERQFSPIAPEQAIKELKEGTLVFFLPSNKKKFQEMEKLSQSKQVDEKTKVKIEFKLRKQKVEMREEYEELMSAADSLYSFSEVLFSFDYELAKIKEANLEIDCINENYQVFACTLPKPFYIVKLYRSDNGESTNLKSWKILDSGLKKIKKPFPQNFGVSALNRFWRAIFNSKEKKNRLNAIDMIVLLNKEFYNYFSKT